MHELVVTEPFGHGGKVYGRGDAITDGSLFDEIEATHPNKTVRRNAAAQADRPQKQHVEQGA